MTAELSMSKSVNQIDQGRLFLELVIFLSKTAILTFKTCYLIPPIFIPCA
jgi:hypothetical protein